MTEIKSMADMLASLEDIETKMRTVRTPEGQARFKAPIHSKMGKDSGMTTGSGKDVQTAARNIITKVKRNQAVKVIKEKLQFKSGVTTDGVTTYDLHEKYGVGYIGNDADGDWFYSFGEGESKQEDWVDDQDAAATAIYSLVFKDASSTSNGDGDDDSMDDAPKGLSAAQAAIYKKLCGKGMKPSQALALAKHAK